MDPGSSPAVTAGCVRMRLDRLGLRVVEIELARAAIDRARLEVALLEARDRQHLGVVAGGEHLVAAFEILDRDVALLRLDAVVAQQLQHALARDAVEERAVRLRRHRDAVLHDEDVGAGEFRDEAVGAEHDGVVEAALLRLGLGAAGLRIEPDRLGVGGGGVRPRPAVFGEAHRHRAGLRQRRRAERDHQARALRIGHQAALLRPHEGAQVERRAMRELADALAQDGLDLRGGLRRLEAEIGGGADRALAMQGEVGRIAVEGARAVEDRRAQPDRLVPRFHDQRIAFDPRAVHPVQLVHGQRPYLTVALKEARA